MDQFVTTYRRDYLWPYTKSFGNKPIEYTEKLPAPAKKCECICFHPKSENISNEEAIKQQDWSRIGPMGQLLDPKLYPIKFGKTPESDLMRLEQPNRFLIKLQEKYPYLYEIMKSEPPVDLIARINKDRFNTTYKIDYCREEVFPDYFERAQEMDKAKELEPKRLPGDSYRQTQRPIKAFNMGTVSKPQKSNNGAMGSGGSGEGGGPGRSGGSENAYAETNFGSWQNTKSEYQDGISRLGGIIVRDKLHYHSSRKTY